MKLVTFLREEQPRLGALTPDGEAVVDLEDAAGPASPALLSDMMAFLEGGDEARGVVERVLAEPHTASTLRLRDLTLLAPLPRPASIRDCMSFEAHVINATRQAALKRAARLDALLERVVGRRRSLAGLLNRSFYERPPYYKSNPRSIVGPEAEVRIPPYGERFDYELEWAVVIGREGADIPRERAAEHVAGYTIFNDFSAREIQLREMRARLGPAKGKDFDTGNALGPWLVTPDELPDPYALTMRARVNGAEWSRGTTAEMHWRFEDLIAYISQSETLYPGDVIGSGTCSGADGSGCGLELGAFLKPGDVIELEVDGLGVLRNRVVGACTETVTPAPDRADRR